MRYHPAGTIPQISYVQQKSSKPSKPPVAFVYSSYDQPQSLDILSLRVYLRDMLKRNKMFRAPAAFPFCASQTLSRNKHESRVRDAHPSVDTRTPYEFKETFPLGDARGSTVTAVISYTPPSMSASRMMSWKIHTYQREAMVQDTLNGRITLAQVEVDPMIMETSYGAEFMTNPRILLQALALSVELAVLITVSIATSKTGHLHAVRDELTGSIRWGDILFVATHPDGYTEIAYVYES
ncbi:hypothetical protein BJ165DRAFT_913760 [Panaeolus papilionaceus]|nr:hypothetical protein BJ165DRAFT_913760 [Panaeolus papilionaceus]